jgi:hypothetical protein
MFGVTKLVLVLEKLVTAAIGGATCAPLGRA